MTYLFSVFCAEASCQVYTVQAGDFMFGIAQAFTVTIDDLVAANPGSTSASTLIPGSLIRIPPFPLTCGDGHLVKSAPKTGEARTIACINHLLVHTLLNTLTPGVYL